MAVVTETIGTTARDHSTITLWEANLDDDPTYDAADDAVGECYDDSVFDEQVAIDGGDTIGLASVTLTVASSERHDGTAGTGARDVYSSGAEELLVIQASQVTLEWFEVSGSSTVFIYGLLDLRGPPFDTNHIVRNCLIHGSVDTLGTTSKPMIKIGGTIGGTFTDNIIYDYEDSTAVSIVDSAVIAFLSSQTPDTMNFSNNTAHDFRFSNGSATANMIGLGIPDVVNRTLQNNIVTDVINAGSGTAVCYVAASYSNATCSHNLASDTTASGTGSLDSKASADQYVSTTRGSEDLHLKSGADAINAGTDLGTTPNGVEIDIDGRDRDAEGDTWDMGAHEFVSVVSGRIMSSLAGYGGLAGMGGIAGTGGGLAG